MYILAWSACFFASAASAEVVVEQVLTGLQSPYGVALQPGTTGGEQYAVFVAESGARRIVMHPNDRTGTALPLITGFPPRGEDNATNGSPPVGPVGLLFLDRRHLVVGLAADEESSVRLYELPDGSLPITADRATQQLKLVREADNRATDGLSVYSLVRTRANDYVPDLLIGVCHRGEGGFELWKMPVRAGTLAEPVPFAAGERQQEATPYAALAVAVSEQGFLVAAKADADGDSPRLAFYEPVDGRIAMQLPLALRQPVALAYSPRTGNLYAADFGADDSPGGVYRIDDAGEPGRLAAAVVKIAGLPRPTALAFGPDGALYTTALGRPEENGTRTGALFKLTGDL